MIETFVSLAFYAVMLLGAVLVIGALVVFVSRLFRH